MSESLGIGLSQPARPLYLNGTSEGVFALFHDASGRRGETDVLLCPPFGRDTTCPYRERRRWAEHLSAGGYPTLQIDLPGSGDSAGGPNDPARLQAWTQAVLTAAAWLRAAGGGRRIVAIGIGVGGLVSYRAVFEQAPIDDLVLWAVPARGRALVRELRVLSRLPVSSGSAPGEAGPSPSPDGAILAAGYLLSATTAAALEALDLTELPLPNAKHRRVLLLGRSGPNVDELLRASLERAGAEVTVASGRGYGTIDEVFERVDSWLAKGEAGRDRFSAPVELAEPERALSAEAGEPSSHEHLTLSCAGVELRETPMWVDRPNGRLFGVLTEPLHSQAQLCAVLLPGQDHIGPNRMFVEIARRWAARGVPTLRIDLAPHVAEYVTDTCAVLEMLRARGLPSRFLLLGVCAGAYCSMHAALRDEQIAAIIMINPRGLIWNEEIQMRRQQVRALRSTRRLRKRLLHSSILPKVFGGEIAPTRFVEVSRSLAALAVRTSLDRSRRVGRSRPGEESRPDPLEPLLDALCDRGQRGLLAFSGREPQREELAAKGLLDSLDRWPNLDVLSIGTSSVETHGLTPLWLQQQVHALVDGVLDRELEQVPEKAIPTST